VTVIPVPDADPVWSTVQVPDVRVKCAAEIEQFPFVELVILTEVTAVAPVIKYPIPLAK
jgi:hypothetical protein